MKNITSLRSHLFDQLNRLAEAKGEELEQEITKASSVVQVAESIIKTAEVENQFIAITRGTGSGFIPLIESGQEKFTHLPPAKDKAQRFSQEQEKENIFHTEK